MAESNLGITGKTLVMLVGPTAVGKSTIMNSVVAQDPDFKRAIGFTTRPPRPNDEPGQYRYLSRQTVAEMITEGQVLQNIVNPANGHIYGTTVADYPGHYNLKDTLSGAVADFERLSFESTRIISMSVPSESWHQWLNNRYPEPSPERTRRLQEAKDSIEWSLRQGSSHAWLINYADQEEQVARTLITIVRTTQSQHSVPPEPQNMLRLVNDLLSYD